MLLYYRERTESINHRLHGSQEGEEITKPPLGRAPKFNSINQVIQGEPQTINQAIWGAPHFSGRAPLYPDATLQLPLNVNLLSKTNQPPIACKSPVKDQSTSH
jgi:hypothetical protein